VGNKRAPLFAGIGAVAVAGLLVLLLVLPKMGQVTEAQDLLDQKRLEQTTLQSQLLALKEAEARAPEARKTIEEVQRRIPPVVDEAGIYQLLRNAGTNSGLDVVTIAIGAPAFDPDSGLSSMTVSMSATGTYFAITEFMYEVETLPRAARTTSVNLSPGEATGSIPTLTLTATILLYTSDVSAGPGSTPGPTESTGA
jgi:Tfp pilus assembly protein PilO